MVLWPTASAATSPGSQITTSAANDQEGLEFGQWLPDSLIFAPASNSGHTRESQMYMPSQSYKMPPFG